MCGIFGWQWKQGPTGNPPTDRQRQVLAVILGMLNDNRGGDSFGWYEADKDKAVRGLGVSSADIMDAASSLSVIGHTRFATVGAKTVENAHPFEIGRIVGAHNGSVSNHLEMNHKHGRQFDVDSMHIFAHLNENKSLKELTGYGSIHWVNRNKPDRIYMARMNDRGILSIADTEYGIVWSSEEKHLKDALEAIRLKFELFKVETHKMYYAESGKLYYSDQKVKISDSVVSMPGYRYYRSFDGGDTDGGYDSEWASVYSGCRTTGPERTETGTVCITPTCYETRVSGSVHCGDHQVCEYGACRLIVSGKTSSFCKMHEDSRICWEASCKVQITGKRGLRCSEHTRKVPEPDSSASTGEATQPDIEVNLESTDGDDSQADDLYDDLDLYETMKVQDYEASGMMFEGRCESCRSGLVIDGHCDEMIDHLCTGYAEMHGQEAYDAAVKAKQKIRVQLP